MPPRRSPLVLRLFALALADGSGFPFSLHPPPAALESQTPQREPRRLPPQATELQRCVSQLSPPTAGCPHPSRCGTAPHRATFPKGEGKGGCRRRAQNLPKCKPQLSPPGRAALIRRGAAQRSTAPPSPRGKARAAAAAERRYCRCAYRRCFAAGGAKAVFPKGKGFSPHKFAVFVAPGRVFCYNTFNNTQNAQKGLFV